MRLPVSIMTSLALVSALGAPVSQAQQRCADVESAKVALRAGPATQSQAAARSQDVQAPRNQDVQAPRNQDIQAPRNRGQAAQLVAEADAACNSGNTALASEKARAAMSLLKQ